MNGPVREWGKHYDPIGDMDWSIRSEENPPPEIKPDSSWADFQARLKRTCLQIPQAEREIIEAREREKIRDTLASIGVRALDFDSGGYNRLCLMVKAKTEDLFVLFHSNAMTLKDLNIEVNEIRAWASLQAFPGKAPLWWETYG